MNCKQGDLAVKVRRSSELDTIPIGAVVRCVKYESGPHWLTDEMIVGWTVEYRDSIESPEGNYWHVDDASLRPIRDNDGQDETLTWKALPTSDRIAAMRKAMKKENV
jgi:hypothetical protein